MRHVFTTSLIPHMWAHATQEWARNPQGSFFFEKDTIYSYRRSWPLAKIFRKVDGTILVLHNANTCSVTTTKHARAVHGASRHLTRVSVPYPVVSPAQHRNNIDYLVNQIAKNHDQTSRVLSVHKAKRLYNDAQTLYTSLQTYMTFFDCYMPTTFPDFAPLLERVRRIETPDPLKDAKRYKAKVARVAKTACLLDISRDKTIQTP